MLALFICVNQVPAQSGGGAGPTTPASDATDKELLTEPLQFIQTMYKLSAEQKAKLQTMLAELLPDHRGYEERIALTLHRLRTARSIAAHDPTMREADRKRMAAKFERQYNNIKARAPLSYANIIRRTETMLSQAQVAEARARIMAKFADRLGGDAPSFDIKKIDALLAGPIPPPDRYQTPQSEATRLDAHAASERPQTPPTNTREPHKRSPSKPDPVSKTVPQRTIKPAPPESEWPQYTEMRSARYGFNAEQKKTAKDILSNCQSRVASYRKLNHSVDALFDEYMQRVDALITVEQRQRIDGIAPPKSDPSRARAHAHTQQPPKRQAPPKPLEPAPPESEWSRHAETTAAHLGFTAQQKETAAAIIESCRSRAAAHRKQHKADYESVDKMTNPAEKAGATRKLNHRLDELYYELTQRVDSLTTVEQKQRTAKGQPPKKKAGSPKAQAQNINKKTQPSEKAAPKSNP